MDLWNVTRGAFVDRLREEISARGMLPSNIRTVGKVSRDWMSIKCPLCTDTGGSASISIHSGHLKCRQCGADEALFDWVQKHQGHKDAWEACKALAGDLGIEIPKRRGQRRATKITESSIPQLVTDLWDDPLAEPIRHELAKRGFTQTMLAKYHVGFDGKGMVFPHILPTGEVRPRAHRWHGNKVPKFSWTATASGISDANYFWPAHLLPGKDDTIWIVEGEMDCLTLRERLQAEGIAVYTWTGGVTSSPAPSHVPEWMRGRRAILVADNDTWQGPIAIWGPDDRKEKEALVRRRKFLETAKVISRFGGEILIGQIPIKPEEIWGGDLRDWYDRGGRDLNDIELLPLSEAVSTKITYAPVAAKDVSSMPGQAVQFQCAVAGIDICREGWRPMMTTIDCQLGSYRCCQRCRVQSEFPEGVIHWDRDEELSAMLDRCIASRDCNRAIERYVMGRPTACPYAKLNHSSEGKKAYVWHGEASEMAVGNEIKVVSTDEPIAHEPVMVEGRVMLELDNPLVVVVADSVKAAHTGKVDIRPWVKDLRINSPVGSNDPEEIRKHLDKRWDDLCSNVTKISNPMLTMVFDLVAHSSRRFIINGKLMRGWLDACIVGVTRCGKTETAACLHEHFGRAGERASTQNNFTSAGLVAANVRGRDGSYRIRPGAFPRNHKKMLIIDEAHLMRDNVRGGDTHILAQLQEIRDRGVADSMKVAGHYRLPAEVRLILLANPVAGSMRSYHYECDAFADIYTSPEVMARMDFGFVVTDEMAMDARESGLNQVKQVWTAPFCTVLRQRAWDLEPEDILINDDAIEAIKERIALWEDVFDTRYPLFTGPDKLASVLRTAIAIANLCFSHNKDPMKCVVRCGHAEAALQIYEESWDQNGYLRKSEHSRTEVSAPLVAEYCLVKNLKTADEALAVLPRLFGEHGKSDLQALLGISYHQADMWLSRLIGTGAYTSRSSKSGTKYTVTDGGAMLLSELIDIARTDPEIYKDRRSRLDNWFISDFSNRPVGPEPSIPHLGIKDVEPAPF